MSEEVKPAHPPIPPNCELFYVDSGATCFQVISLRSKFKRPFKINTPERVQAIPPNWRLVIAAVARCAWLDERERRSLNVEEFEAQYKGDLEALKKNGEVYWLQQGWWADEGNKNAAAWAAWSRQA